MHQMRWEWDGTSCAISYLCSQTIFQFLLMIDRFTGFCRQFWLPLMLTELAWILAISRIHTSSSRIFDLCASLVSQEFMNIVPVFMSVWISIHELVRIWVHVPCLLFVTFVEEYHWITSQIIFIVCFCHVRFGFDYLWYFGTCIPRVDVWTFFLPNAS